MRDLRTEPDGTVTAEWHHREVRDARRGFYKRGRPLSPSGSVEPIVDGGDYGDLNAHEIRMVQDFRTRRAKAIAESRRLA